MLRRTFVCPAEHLDDRSGRGMPRGRLADGEVLFGKSPSLSDVAVNYPRSSRPPRVVAAHQVDLTPLKSRETGSA